MVLDVNAYSAAREDTTASSVAAALSRLGLTSSSPSVDDHTSSEGHSHHAHALSQISTLAVPLPERLSAKQVEALDLALQALLWEGRLPAESPDHPGIATKEGSLEILRTKGYFVTEEGKEQVIQGVREIYEMREVGRIGQEITETKEGKLVLIGKGLHNWMVEVIADAVRGSL